MPRALAANPSAAANLTESRPDGAQSYLAHHDHSETELFVGRAQEKTTVFRTEKRRNPETGST